MRRQRKTYRIMTTLSPGLTDGSVLEIEGQPYLVVDAEHEIGTCAVSRLRVVEPGWLWKLGYRIRRFGRRIRRALHVLLQRCLGRYWRRFL